MNIGLDLSPRRDDTVPRNTILTKLGHDGYGFRNTEQPTTEKTN